jgi:glycosyltransferase involved in cell wall biosynthesis
MRILIVTPVFPPDIGGHATAVPLLARGLLARGHVVTVLTLSDEPGSIPERLPYAIERIPRRLWKFGRWPRTIASIIRLGRRSDLVLGYGLGLETAVANTVLGKPWVLKVVGDLAWERASLLGWVHDDFDTFQRRRYGVRVEALRRLQAWWVRRAGRIVVHSRYLATHVQAWGTPAEKISIVPNAADVPDPLTIQPFPIDTPLRVIAVARLVPWKGLDGLIEVVAGLPDCGLIIVGDGPDRPKLQGIIDARGVGDRVQLLGIRQRDDALSLMAASDVFVLNSSWEGLSHTLLEAMALGVPAIATAVGASPDVVIDGENGCLIDAGDNRALRDVLARLAGDPAERRRLADGARRTALRYSPGAQVAAMTSLLDRAAAGERP